ncbi:lipocalin family protein [Flavobacterium sp.]|uniref:lipocalin family protein n=1 Tax=Flavobacterium sp. TaxID=239 RepID=UPI003BDBCFDA
MKITFRLTRLLIMLSIITFLLFSCSKDDSTSQPSSPSIEGKWQYTKIGTITNNQEILNDYQHESGCTKDYIEVLSNNVIKSHEFDNPNCQETINTGTWNRTNNSLILTFPNQPSINGEIMELSNTILKTKFFNPGIIDVEVLTRIN